MKPRGRQWTNVSVMPDGAMRWWVSGADWHGFQHLRDAIDKISNALNSASHNYVEANAVIDDDAEWSALLDRANADWLDGKVPPDDSSPYSLIATAFVLEETAIKELRLIIAQIRRGGVLPWTFLHDKIF
jgi:hypothetical protein